MSKTYLGIAVVLILIIGLGLIAVRTARAPGDEVACTLEAKICPDGSSVGRGGPNCEFAACPEPSPTPTSTPTSTTGGTLSVGQQATINGTTINILGPVEDSRCAIDVQCVWAGTVKVRVALDSYNRDFTFTLGTPQVVGDKTIELVGVTPGARRSTETVPQSEYRLTFSVVPQSAPRATIVPYTSGVRGVVMLGPTCPVMRDPPDPGCADKPYATTITVRRASSSTTFATGKSDAQGSFTFSLPPGAYTLTAAGGTTLPRCSERDVTVATEGYSTVNISCDTGIR